MCRLFERDPFHLKCTLVHIATAMELGHKNELSSKVEQQFLMNHVNQLIKARVVPTKYIHISGFYAIFGMQLMYIYNHWLSILPTNTILISICIETKYVIHCNKKISKFIPKEVQKDTDGLWHIGAPCSSHPIHQI